MPHGHVKRWQRHRSHPREERRHNVFFNPRIMPLSCTSLNGSFLFFYMHL